MRRNSRLNGSGSDEESVTVADQGRWPRCNKAKVTILTATENRVLTLVTLAKTNKEIARALGISPATVKRHLENLLRKLKLKNRVEAAVYGLISQGCPAGAGSACALEVWRNRWKPDSENGPISP